MWSLLKSSTSKCLETFIIIYYYYFLFAPALEHRASVKRFVALRFLNVGHSVGLLGRVISPSQGRYLTQTQNKHAHKHPYLEWVSNTRSQRPSERRQFMP
jgi:hypothetical protein